MRMRKKKHRGERLEACGDLLIHNPGEYKGKWLESFGGHRLLLEAGCGKGGFACGMAAANPDDLYLAVEKSPDVLLLALEKAKAAGLPNLRFIMGDMALLSEAFAEGEVSVIFLNFSDPWPKKGHEKRRLSSPGFLELYRRLLPEGGSVAMKTDNAGLFDYSLESFAAGGFEAADVTRDLHSSPLADGNIMTEYEERFSSEGVKICRAEFVRGNKN